MRPKANFDYRPPCFFKPAYWTRDYVVEAIMELLSGTLETKLASQIGEEAMIIVKSDVPKEKIDYLKQALVPFASNKRIWFIIEQKNGDTEVSLI
jgi:hypothetical protein